MRYQRTIAVLAMTLPLVLVLALPGGATAEPGENQTGSGFLTGPADGDPEDLAVAYVEREHDSLELEAGDVDELFVRSSYVSSHTGATHVAVGQRHQGLEVFGVGATVTVAPDGSIAFVGGNLVSGLDAASGAVATSAADAVEGAADGLAVDTDEVDVEEAPQLGWQPTEDGSLRLAWQLVLDETDDADLWNVAVDAQTGELIAADNWTASHSAEELEHLATTSSSFDPGGSPNPVNDGSSYRVVAFPDESPNDGPRTLVTNPADADASPFGWHDTDGVAGPEFTITRGNNVHAALDQDANNQPDAGQDVDGGPSLNFDFPADLSEHAQAYREAATANLFYFNNIIHDVMWHLGFDEPSGNFQANNYGRGGNGGDYVRADAQDGNGTNNANFSTPAADGSAPRMQMYLWPGNQLGAQNQIVVGANQFNAGWARFGPPATNAGVSGPLVVAANNGCQASDYPEGSGYIAITVNVTSGGGSCTNPARTAAAQAAGAAAVIIANTTGTGTGAGPILTGAQTGTPVGIPAVSVTAQVADSLRALAGETAQVRKHPSHPGIRDGDLENGIIIHEYGHGISNRLTGGLNINCLSGNEQMGEGWSDFYGTIMTLNPALDDPEDGRGMGPYALFQPDRHGAGIRVTRYSRNLDINRLTYDNIKTGGWNGGTIAAPHGVGWAWNTVLYDMTWDLIDAHGFNGDLYGDPTSGGNLLALQLVTDGLKLQGCGPNFVTGRAAIIAADQLLTGGENRCLLWNTFARRGLGFSANGGGTSRDDGSQAFDLPADCAPTFRYADGELWRLNFNGGITEGLDAKINHALAQAEEWLSIPGKELVALSHLDRAIHLLLWQADVIEGKDKPNQGDADALRALAQTITNLRNSLTP